MKKHYLVLPLLLSISAGSYAMTITKGKLISHHDFIPSGTHASFKDIDIKLPEVLVKFKSSQATQDVIEINVKATSGLEPVQLGDDVHIAGQSRVFISNYSNSSHNYTIETQVCELMTMACYSTKDVVALDVGGFLSINRYPDATFVMNDWNYFGVITSVQEDNQNKIYRSMDYVMIQASEKNKR